MKISMIAAMSSNRVIGLRGELPWLLPIDLRYFREKTYGRTVIMGRKTWDSVGKPLPGRRNIVVSRQEGLSCPGAEVARSLEEALTLAAGEEEIFLIGGGELYRQGLPIADRIYLTKIDAEFEGDTFFPEFDAALWKETAHLEHPPDPRNPYPCTFLIYEREGAPDQG